MFLTVFVIAISLTKQGSHTFFSNANRTPQSLGSAGEECNVISTGFEVTAGNHVPPKNVFYFGKYDVNSWNKTIGADQKFKRHSFRLGLLTAETLSSAEPVSSNEKGLYVAIEIKGECLQQERVSSMVGLPSSPKFKNWYNKNADFSPLNEWKKQCFNEDGIPKSEAFQFFETPDQIESKCEKVVEQFWNDQKIGMIQDHLSPKSWLIRDQNCIQSANYSAQYWAESLLNHSDLWLASCDSHQSQKEQAKLLFKSLTEASEVLNSSIEFSKLFSDNPNKVSPVELISFDAKDFAKALDEAIMRCKKMNHLSELKDGIKIISDQFKTYDSPDIKVELERKCL